MATLNELINDIKYMDNDDYPYVDVHLKNAVATEFGAVSFDAKVDGLYPISSTWYKNGAELLPNPRFKYTFQSNWHRLSIRNIKKTDFGIYTIVCRNNLSYVISQATLHVIPDKKLMPSVKGRDTIFLAWPKSEIRITEHLKSVKIKVGDPIILRVEISKLPCAEPQYHWYKNNRFCCLLDEGTQLISNENDFAEYVKYNAEVKDSGVYTVMVTNSDVVLSSTAEVIVMKPNFQHYHAMPNTSNPSFIQPLPDELDVFETEEVKMICKTSLDIKTEVFIFKDGKKLKEDYNIGVAEVEGRGIEIKIKQAWRKDSGVYTVVLRNKEINNVTFTRCILSVSPAPQVTLPEVELLRPLRIAISCIGNSVCLYCRFKLPENYLFFVVWRIGFYQVERSTSQFQVISCQEGTYLLYIKRMDPDMAGEVSCQLRVLISTKKSIQVAITKGFLVHVPTEAMLEESYGNSCILAEKIYVDMDDDKSTTIYKASKFDALIEQASCDGDKGDVEDEERESEAIALPVPTPEEASSSLTVANRTFIGAKNTSAVSAVLMEVLYCRLKTNSEHFLMMESCRRSPLPSMSDVTPNDDISLELQLTTEQIESEEVVDIEWTDKSLKRNNNWYAIYSEQPYGGYYLTGITSVPRMTIVQPKAGKISRFQIRIVEAMDSIPEASIVIYPPRDAIIKPSQSPHRPIEEFNQKYEQIGEPMGIGAYGAVYLVRSNDGSLKAAKIIMTRTDKRRDFTKREIEIMKRLHHRRIVQMQSSYYSRNQLIIVMDYLWGGELFERIVEEENFQERTAVHYIHQICEGLEYLHSQRIVHLDIKPENVVCTSRNSRNIKIVDFGLSRVLGKDLVRAIDGTRDYVAPEVLNYEAIQTASDMWSLGVVTYVMLSGTTPFSGNNWPGRAAAITLCYYNFKDPAFDTVTDEAKHFIKSLLLFKPADRLTAHTAKQHPWMVADAVDDIGVGQTQQWRSNLRTYLETNKARWQFGARTAYYDYQVTNIKAGTNLKKIVGIIHSTAMNPGRVNNIPENLLN